MVVPSWVAILDNAVLVVLAASVVVLMLRLRQERARRRTEESRSPLNMSVSGADEALWDLDLAHNRAQYSERWASMLGYSLNEISSKADGWEKLVHPDDLPGVKERLEAHLEGRSLCYQAEFRMRCRDGDWRWIQSRGRALERSPDGTPVRISGTHQDISLRKQTEQALEHERDLLMSLLDYLPERIYFKDRDCRFLRASKSVAKFHGFSDPAELVGKTDAELFSGEHAGQARDDEQALLDGRVPIIAKEERETWPDGRETWALTTKLPFRDRTGAIVGTFGISRDITADKRLEKELRESKAAV